MMAAFVMAQGGAVFVTALVLYRMTGASSWFRKIELLALSFLAWILFTLLFFFWGVSSYIVFFGLASTCLMSSLVYLAIWLAAPLFMAKKNV